MKQMKYGLISFLLIFTICPVLYGESLNELFIDSPDSVFQIKRDQEEQNMAVIRSRYVNVKFDCLAGKGLTQGVDAIVLNLFKDVSLTATKDRLERRSEDCYTWFGRIEGGDYSHAILVVEDGSMAGSIMFGRATYQIQDLGDGVNAIYEIDPSAFPEDAPPIVPPEEMLKITEIAPPTPNDDDGSLIDVMIVYTEDVANYPANIASKIQLAIDQTNQAYANSNINQRVRLVHSAQVTYTETGISSIDVSRLQKPSDGYMDEVHSLRNTYGADVVSLLVENLDFGGRAFLMTGPSNTFESYAFSVVWVHAGAYVLAHEMGHNMGCHHDRYVWDGQGAYDYSHGYVYNPWWHTIMAYSRACDDFCIRIPHFSNPSVSYNGTPTGIPEGASDSADNAKTLNNTASIVANFRQTVVPTSSTTTTTSAPGAVDDTHCLECHDASFPVGSLHSTHINGDCNDCHVVAGDTPASSKCIVCHPIGDPGKCDLVLYHEDSVDYDPSGTSCLMCHCDCDGLPGAFTVPIPDTGQTKCYDDDETQEIICPQSGEPLYGQDAQYIANPQSYTKLDENGDDLPDSDSEWVMVRDNVTGLVWEVKTDDGSINDRDNQYDWYDAQDVFIATLNSQNFGGHNDWRLPEIKELSTIVNLGITKLSINTDYFPNTVSSRYWSSTTSARDPSLAWRVNFGYGGVYYYDKSSYSYVRAVRGGQCGSFDSSFNFEDNGDDTVTDTETGLMWQQFTAPGVYNWQEALSYCENLSLAGYNDWRLPNRNELQSLVDYNQYDPAINANFSPNTMSSPYWSSTTYPEFHFDFLAYAWQIGFYRGNTYETGHKHYGYYVRAVRECRTTDDYDCDSILNEDDNCPDDYNPDQENNDTDDLGDVCDNCPDVNNEDQSDNDEDRVGDTCDNCPDDVNLNQIDKDNDGIGDMCDLCTDLDGDEYGVEGLDNSECAYPEFDCDDNDPDVSPGTDEICDDGIDNDCDGLTDCSDDDCSLNWDITSKTAAQFKLNDNLDNTTVIEELNPGSYNGILMNAGNTSDISETGKVDEALHFDGSDDHFYVPDSNDDFVSLPMSISLWFNSDTLPTTIESNIATVGNSWNLFIDDDDNKIKWYVNNSSNDGFYVVSDSAIETGIWYHAVVTVTATEMNMYVNNVLQSDSGSRNVTDIQSSTIDLKIGAWGDVVAGCFDGLIDEVKIHNAVMDQDDVDNLYNDGDGTDLLARCGCNCPDDGNECTDDECDGSGSCTHPFSTAGTPCGDPSDTDCTNPDTCDGSGVCLSNNEPSGTACTDDSNVCTDDACDGAGLCLHPNNNYPCNDGIACTQNDVCAAGECNGIPNDSLCSDGNGCTDDICTISTGCSNPNNNNPCDDNIFCNGTDTCSGESCSIHAGNPCPQTECNTCQEDTDICFNPAGTVCTNDGNVCTDDQCDGVGACVHLNNSDPCSDGIACTHPDNCSGGACSGTPNNSDCDDTNVCTTDTCTPGAGCEYENNSNSCDDGDVCTTNDTCSAGTCVGGTPLDCNDGNVCTDGSCNPVSGCANTPNTDPCNDDIACTESDICTDGICNGTPNDILCSDGNVCTDDICTIGVGCSNPLIEHTITLSPDLLTLANPGGHGVTTALVKENSVAVEGEEVLFEESADPNEAIELFLMAELDENGEAVLKINGVSIGLGILGVKAVDGNGDEILDATYTLGNPVDSCASFDEPTQSLGIVSLPCDTEITVNCEDDLENPIAGYLIASINPSTAVTVKIVPETDALGVARVLVEAIAGGQATVSASVACGVDTDEATVIVENSNTIPTSSSTTTSRPLQPPPNTTTSSIETTTSPSTSTSSTTTAEPTTTIPISEDCMLHISISPPEGGTTSPPPPQYFVMGCRQTLTVEAIPNPGHKFSHWEGAAQGSDNPITIEITWNASITAVFVLDFCPIETLYGEDSEEVALLRYFRDNVLSQTPEGQELIKLYYQLSPVILRAMEKDDEFRKEAKEMIDKILPMIREEVE